MVALGGPKSITGHRSLRNLASEVPPLVEHKPGQFAACHFAGDPVPAVSGESSAGAEAANGSPRPPVRHL